MCWSRSCRIFNNPPSCRNASILHFIQRVLCFLPLREQIVTHCELNFGFLKKLCFSWFPPFSMNLWRKSLKSRKKRGLKVLNFSILQLKKSEGRSPSHFCNSNFEKFDFFKFLFFLDFDEFCQKFIEIWGNHEKHNFLKNPKFNSQWVTICSLKGKKHKTRWIKCKIEAFVLEGGYWKFCKMRFIKKFPAKMPRIYDVPSMCSLKARKWDIETFETALESSESVLSG